VAYGSGGRGKETTGGSVEPLPPFLLGFSHTRDYPEPPQPITDCHPFVTRLASREPPNGDRTSERRTVPATGVPERQDFEVFRVCDEPVVDVVMNSCDVYATHAGQRKIPGVGTDLRLD
jgi:hypothetical protein